MCHPIIMEYVKGKALSRRDLFLGSAAAGALLWPQVSGCVRLWRKPRTG